MKGKHCLASHRERILATFILRSTMHVDHSLQMGLSDEWTVLAAVGSEETSQGLVCNQHCSLSSWVCSEEDV